MTALIAFLDRLAIATGAYVRGQWAEVLRMFHFGVELLKNTPLVFRNIHLTLDQIYAVGVTSVPLVVTTSVFTGAVVAWQMAYQFADMIPLTYVGMAVGKAVMLELGPLLTGMVIAGRIGSALCSELGTMAVTEQLDAMKCLGLNPYRFLLAPRLVGTVLILPILTIISMAVALLGGFFVAHVGKDVTASMFFFGVRLFYTDWDLAVGLMKSLVFGFIIAGFGVYYGYHATKGAEGVGKATKSTVVAAMTWILISSTLMSEFLLI
jgi:phospholipid/cholesterol/gamma-HCH transport system permease protein